MDPKDINKVSFGKTYSLDDLPDSLLPIILTYGIDSIHVVVAIQDEQSLRRIPQTGILDEMTVRIFREEKEIGRRTILADINGTIFNKPQRMVSPPELTIPGSKNINHLWNSYGGAIGVEAKRSGIPVGVALAVFMTEAGRYAYSDSGLIIIRFEAHIFKRKTGKAGTNKDHTGKQEREWEMLKDAAKVDKTAAFYSTSFGLPQIMGFNCQMVGYLSPEEMAVQFHNDVTNQIKGFFSFCSHGLIDVIKTKDWKEFTRRYNGPGQVEHYSKVLTNNLALVATLGLAT